MNNEKRKIFLVDDDALYLKSLEVDFAKHNNYDVKTFATGELCIKNLSYKPDVIILDYHLDGIDKKAMNGLQTLAEIKKSNADIPVVMLSSQDKIDVAIKCMHYKAFDYVVKSETAFMRLQKIIVTIFIYRKMENELKWYMNRM